MENQAKRVLVTGGTRGIGREIVLAFAYSGASVVTCHRQDSPEAESLAHELKEVSGDHGIVRANVTEPADVARLIQECRARFGGLDAVVHSAGVISHIPFDELTVEEWRRVLDTNLTGAYLVTRYALPLLSSGSAIVFIGSKAATVGIPLRAHYTAAKAGLVGLSRSLARELGSRGIRVNVVAPGIVETEEARSLPPEQQRRYQSITSLGRMGQPAEIAAAVQFCVSDAASYLTGETINVDGGT